MGVEKVNTQSKGGTELLIDEFKQNIPEAIYEHFHIIPSRNRGIDKNKIPIYWAHDLPGDPECDHLKAGGYNQYERLVFVSNWQMQLFISAYGIPWHKCIVIPNAINPIPNKPKQQGGPIRLIYHTTPHRGLELLSPVFNSLSKKYDIELDVFSSFNIYGWGERDEQYKQVFEQLQSNPKVRYHGFAEQSVVREAVSNAHIFAYPSIWMETSCRCLMEAMSAGLLCVHSNLGALYETAAGWTWMYQYQQDKRDHLMVFAQNLSGAIEHYWDESVQYQTQNQSSYANIYYSWQMRKVQWTNFLKQILADKRIQIE